MAAGLALHTSWQPRTVLEYLGAGPVASPIARHAQVYKVAEEAVPAAEAAVKDLQKQVGPEGVQRRAAGCWQHMHVAVAACRWLR